MEERIEKLWEYLEIDNNETLIINYHHYGHRKDMFAVVVRSNGRLVINLADTMPDIEPGKPVRIISYRDENGHFQVPDVSQLIKDREMDY